MSLSSYLWNISMISGLTVNLFMSIILRLILIISLFFSSRSSHRDSFRKYLFFFSRSNLLKFFQECPFAPRTDMNFPGGSICSSNRHEFSRRAYQKDMFFQGGSICSSNRPYYLIEQILIFPRNPYLVLEHIRIFQEPLFSHRTDTHFPGSPI